MERGLSLGPNAPGCLLPNPALFPAQQERLRIDNWLTQDLAAAQQRVAAGAVTPTIDKVAFHRELAAFDFDAPRPLVELLSWTSAQLEAGVVHLTNPRYFGLFNPSPAFPAQCADRLAAAFNPQLASSVTSPAATAIEAHVIKAMASRAGLPADSAGHFTGGGSEANSTALICALTKANPQFAENGVLAFAGRPAFYVSRECHLAWVKIAHAAGIGRTAARMVPTDGTGRLDVQALKALIAADRVAGFVPVMIAATAGTTNAGMIDPLRECAAVAAKAGLWYHIDAAWAGALLLSDKLKGALAGIGSADSITIDAHKWLATTMGCGMFLCRDAQILGNTFHVAASFMPPSQSSDDPYVNSLQWSRRFLGLRLFLNLATAGWRGYGEHVERSVALADQIGTLLAVRGWRVANRSVAAVLCLEPPNYSDPARTIAARVVASGRAWVSAAAFEGRDYVRVCVTHGETSETDVAHLIVALEAAMSQKE